MRINQATLDLVKEFEGLRLASYRDPVGIWTIGYGLTTAAGIGVSVGAGMTITEGEAEQYLHDVLGKFSDHISHGFKRTPTDNQFGAMLSLAYNIGPGAFLKSTCLKRFNAGDIDGAAQALTWFNKAGGKALNGLVRRRNAESHLFLKDEGQASLPSPDGERHASKSTTLQAVVGASATVGTTTTAILGQLDQTSQYIVLGGSVVTVLLLIYIARERIKRWANGDR